MVTFKIKSGCKEDSLKAHNFTNAHTSHFVSYRAVQIDDGLVAHIAECESFDNAFEAQTKD